MKTVTITIDENDKIHMDSNDFTNDLQELFYVLATSTRQIAKMIEENK